MLWKQSSKPASNSSRHTAAQAIGFAETVGGGRKPEEVGVSKRTIYVWKAKYGGLDGGPGAAMRNSCAVRARS
jgi:hypothetical protein